MSGKRYWMNFGSLPQAHAWTSKNQHKLDELKKMEFDWADTAAGRLEQTKQIEIREAVVGEMDKKERDELRRKLELADEDKDEDAAA